MAIISVNYDEPNPETYKSVEITLDNGEVLIFDSGDFIKDWFNLHKKIITEKLPIYHLSHSSSVDHFLMDGAPYESVYLHVLDDDGKAELKYLNRDDKNWVFTQRHIYESKTKFFVKEGNKPTWEELKEYCK